MSIVLTILISGFMIFLMTFHEWFFNKYLDWQRKNGKAPATKFADWLEIKTDICNKYLRGEKQPRGENLKKIADKLGYEAYDILGYLRPDKAIREMNEIYSELPDDLKEEFMDVIREYKKLHGKRG